MILSQQYRLYSSEWVDAVNDELWYFAAEVKPFLNLNNRSEGFELCIKTISTYCTGMQVPHELDALKWKANGRKKKKISTLIRRDHTKTYLSFTLDT
jgi:hypothetical protein